MKRYVYAIEEVPDEMKEELGTMIDMVPKTEWERHHQMSEDMGDEDVEMVMNVLEPNGIFEMGEWTFNTFKSADEIRRFFAEQGYFEEVEQIRK
jgi:hypothetical protein